MDLKVRRDRPQFAQLSSFERVARVPAIDNLPAYPRVSAHYAPTYILKDQCGFSGTGRTPNYPWLLPAEHEVVVREYGRDDQRYA